MEQPHPGDVDGLPEGLEVFPPRIRDEMLAESGMCMFMLLDI